MTKTQPNLCIFRRQLFDNDSLSSPLALVKLIRYSLEHVSEEVWNIITASQNYISMNIYTEVLALFTDLCNFDD